VELDTSKTESKLKAACFSSLPGYVLINKMALTGLTMLLILHRIYFWRELAEVQRQATERADG